MISLNRFVMAGLFRINFRGLSKILVPENGVVNLNCVYTQVVNLRTFMKIYSVRNVVGNRNRKFSSEIAKSSEDTFEDIQQDSRKDEPSTDKIFEEIAAGDPHLLKKLKIIEFEVAVLREEEHKLPDKITKKNWEDLLELNSLALRRKHLSFLRLNELKTLSKSQKSHFSQKINQQLKEEQGLHYYGLSGQAMFMRIYEKVISRVLCQRLLNAKFEIVMDCSYDDYMSAINLKMCARQISNCITHVKSHKHPSNFTLCNLPKGSALGKLIPIYCQKLAENPHFHVHSGSYLDLFPKERLVYLSPHAKNELKTIDPNDVLVIGAYVDRGSSVKASLAKAKEHRLRVARLPIDEYVVWKKGSKALPLGTVVSIILDMLYYNDWRIALKHIPKRCLTD